MKYKVGDIIFFNYSDSFYLKLIKFYNRITYGVSGATHVGIITKITKDYITIAEALSSGFTISTYEKWWIEGKLGEGLLEIGDTFIHLTNIEKTAKKYEGTPYGWLDILGISLSFLFGFKFLKTTGANKMICSEAVSRLLYDCSKHKINISKEMSKPFDLITPIDIYFSEEVRIYG